MTATDKQVIRKAARSASAARIAEAASVGLKALLVKIVLLGIVDAIAVFALFILIANPDARTAQVRARVR